MPSLGPILTDENSKLLLTVLKWGLRWASVLKTFFLNCYVFLKNLIFNYVSVCVCMCCWGCSCEWRYPRKPKEGSGPLKLELQEIFSSCLMWVLKTEFGSSARTVYIFKTCSKQSHIFERKKPITFYFWLPRKKIYQLIRFTWWNSTETTIRILLS